MTACSHTIGRQMASGWQITRALSISRPRSNQQLPLARSAVLVDDIKTAHVRCLASVCGQRPCYQRLRPNVLARVDGEAVEEILGLITVIVERKTWVSPCKTPLRDAPDVESGRIRVEKLRSGSETQQSSTISF
jgi:hypothetical protein